MQNEKANYEKKITQNWLFWCTQTFVRLGKKLVFFELYQFNIVLCVT